MPQPIPHCFGKCQDVTWQAMTNKQQLSKALLLCLHTLKRLIGTLATVYLVSLLQDPNSPLVYKEAEKRKSKELAVTRTSCDNLTWTIP